jgi:hypothetical protein
MDFTKFDQDDQDKFVPSSWRGAMLAVQPPDGEIYPGLIVDSPAGPSPFLSGPYL